MGKQVEKDIRDQGRKALGFGPLAVEITSAVCARKTPLAAVVST